MTRVQKLVISLLCVVYLAGCAPTRNELADQDHAPPAPREFRAVWVATVANIDWPSKPGLSTPDQQAEAIAILDKCKQLNINAVVFQVRPGCDALYESELEPWSYYLTGEQGKRPDPYYDPLQFWIEESHRRGIELHAWFNPFRAKLAGATYKQSPDHVSVTRPELVKKYGALLWMDPGEEAARKQTIDVFLDVTKRYDVDGIHIDDYFYPYPISEKQTRPPTNGLEATTGPAVSVEVPFPDDAAWAKYQSAGGKLSRDDWRRDNINQMVEQVYGRIKRVKPHVKFGISPFGIGKPALRPAQIKGFSQYDKLYADADLWLQRGWCDYWTPQLYWPITQTAQAYPVLLNYWVEQNKQDRNYWPGLFTSRHAPRTEAATQPSTQPVNENELVDQIKLTRSAGVNGHVHFSMKPIMQNAKLANQLKELYATPALIPASPWLDNKPPAKPRLSLKPAAEGIMSIVLTPGGREKPATWAVWCRYGDAWMFDARPGDARKIDVPLSREGKPLTGVCVSAVDRCGNESSRVTQVP